MNQLESWVEQISHWYETRKHDQDESLQSLILSAPDSIWGPTITELQSKAIACWLDGCLRIFHSLRYREPSVAYQYLQLASSKLQACASHTQADIELKDWSMKRLQHLTVLALEFCNQQHQNDWQRESHQLIEAHVLFMAAQGWNEIRKHDQGSQPYH
ncbi:transcriptional regulator [Vibrio sp. 404]|uniref:Transcriptional regulator n=1 Tax=Vibrio marinisediminis TaxID=2758441 RepID=A0A7W2IS84_9VIBR|nr:transcriptional regulator [Vibrio marinisediminis]MBA5761211.1 transcriptional regulator [Vibrio marinisediminis]